VVIVVSLWLISPLNVFDPEKVDGITKLDVL
jgi:hypothetical protein